MNVLDYQSDEYLRYMVLHLVTTWVADVIMQCLPALLQPRSERFGPYLGNVAERFGELKHRNRKAGCPQVASNVAIMWPQCGSNVAPTGP